MTQHDNSPLFHLTLRVPAAVRSEVEGALFLEAPWGWEEEEQENQSILHIHFPMRDNAESILKKVQVRFPSVEAELHAEETTNWMEAWKVFFTPVEINERFVIIPPWEEHRTDGRPVPIIIEPKMAFGTGHHPTTLLCLKAISQLHSQGSIRSGQQFLDVGTGSGILAIGCAKLGLTGFGVDIDPVAVANARENCFINQVYDRIGLWTGTIIGVKPAQHFDLIVANILANPLVDMAPYLTQHMKQPGCLILSGILRDQESFVASAYENAGLGPPAFSREGDWSALIWDQSNMSTL